MLKISLILGIVYSTIALDLPSNFKKCNRNDDNLNECLRDAIQDALPKLADGLPEFHFAPLQPFFVPSIVVGEGKRVVQVVQKFKNTNIYGIIKAKINAFNGTTNATDGKATINAFLPEITFEADYEFDGRVLFLPIQGVGKAKIVLSDMVADIVLAGNEFKKKDVDYIKVDQFDLKLTPAKVFFQFDNLFDGDQRLGGEMNALLNENWKEVWTDVKESYEELYATIFKNLVNLIFKKVPHEKLFPR